MLCAEYGIDEVHEATSIPYESLKTMRKIFKSSGGFKKRGRKVRYLAFDEHIKQWILEKRRFATKVTARRVFNYVRHEAEKQGYTDLKFGWGWFRRFLRRHNFSLRKPSSNTIKSLSLVADSANKFIDEIQALIESGAYDPAYILNIDETGVSTEVERMKTVEERGKRNVRVKTTGKSKTNTTVMLGGTMTGEKLKAFVVLPDKGVKSLGIIVPSNIVLYHRPEGSWIDRKAMDDYVRRVLIPWARNIPEGKRALLLVDGYEGHMSKEIETKLQNEKIDLKIFPSCTTSYLQPMDLSVNGPFKMNYSQHWDEYQYKLTEETLTKLQEKTRSCGSRKLGEKFLKQL